MLKYIFLFFLCVFGFQNRGNAQEKDLQNENLPKFFLDCDICDQDFYRQEINYINFVRDRYLSDIYSLLTTNLIGTGGNEYNLFLVGQNEFTGINDTLKFQSFPNASHAEIRESILKLIKKGLLKYLVNTNLIDYLNYEINSIKDDFNSNNVKDKWNFWTFNLSSGLKGDGNSYQNNVDMQFGININRTTDKFKIEIGGGYGFNRQNFKINDSVNVIGLQRNTGIYHLMAFSLGKHMAFGQYFTYFQSTQQNLNHAISYFPAIEYNFFEYEKASRRQLRLIYRGGLRYQNYFDLSINNKMKEFLFPHSFVLQWLQIEKWGTLNVALGSWHYLNYSKKYNISVNPSIEFNPISGLRISFWSDLSVVNDQFYLRKSEATTSEILLNQIELETDYMFNYGIRIGYAFGSRYNNVINVRFNLDDNYW